MNVGELRRLKVIQVVLEKKITQVEAGELLRLTDRQVRRITVRIKKGGDKGIGHRARGKPSNRCKPEEIKERVMKLCRDRCADFGPTLASEKLWRGGSD